MAEAMINHEYLATSLPTLQPSEGRGGMIVESNNNHNNNNNYQVVQESERSSGKSVVFDLPPSPKRQKISKTTTTKMSYSSNDNKLTYQMIITNIQQSISRTSRCDALSAACESFNHNDEGLHDEEIKFGVDLALCKHLGYLLFQKAMMNHDEYQDCNHSNNYNKNNKNKNSHHHHYYEPVEISILPVNNNNNNTGGGREEQMEEELSQTCKAMEMVYRCSADSIHSSFNRIGKDLLPLLIHIIQQDLDDRNLPLTKNTTHNNNNNDDDSITTASSVHATEQRQESSSHHHHHHISSSSSNNHNKKNKHLLAKKDLCLKSCTKIMGHFARVGALTEPLAYHPKVLSTLKRLVSCYHRTSFAAVPIEARLNALWTIANLACNVENMVMMACHPGLIDTLLQVSKHSPQEDPQQQQESQQLPDNNNNNNTTNILEYMELLRSRSIAVRAILNLSWAPENKIPFAEHTDLVHTLLRTVIHRTSSWGGHGKGVSAILLQSRRHAAGALRNLAAAPRRTKRFLCCQSKNSFDLLKKLADIAQNDPDQAVKDRIHATFHNLVCADTAEIYTANQDVMKVLQEAASKGNARINYQAQDSHNMALRTLRTLEKAIPEDLDAYKTLRPIIDSVEDSLKHCESRN